MTACTGQTEYACCVFKAKAAVMLYNAVLARAAQMPWAYYAFGFELTFGCCALLFPKLLWLLDSVTQLDTGLRDLQLEEVVF